MSNPSPSLPTLLFIRTPRVIALLSVRYFFSRLRFDDFEGGAVELLRLLYREQIGNSISVDQPFEILNGFQSTLKCCGLWSYSDYVTNLNLSYSSSAGLLPLSCCADGKS